jgi:hypothetical protein
MASVTLWYVRGGAWKIQIIALRDVPEGEIRPPK